MPSARSLHARRRSAACLSTSTPPTGRSSCPMHRPSPTSTTSSVGLSACECERVSEANLAQALHLLNSDEIQGKLSRGGGRADLLAGDKDKRPDTEKIQELFLWTFAHPPSDAQLQTALAHLAKHAKNK